MEILIGIAVILGMLIVVICVALYIMKRVKGIFKDLFGNESLKQVVQERDFIEQNVPKSISSMTKFYLPQILRDFPDFNWEVFKVSAQNTIKSTLMAISTHNINLLPKEADSALREQVDLSIKDDEMGGVLTRYDDIVVHDTQIISYKKEKGMCVIKMQSAVGLLSWSERESQVISGSKDKIRQTKYESTMVYIQDLSQVENQSEMSKGLTCPNCGGAITNLGSKYCEYCGSGVVEYIRKVWRFSTIMETLS